MNLLKYEYTVIFSHILWQMLSTIRVHALLLPTYLSVAEWLRQWANLGVITTTELLGGRGFESHSRHE